MSNLDLNTMSQQILALAPDAILFSDREGIIRLWNSGAERIFGFQAEQAIGQSLDIIIPEKLRERHWEGYHKTMKTGETRYGTELLAVPATNADGDRLSTEFSIVGRFAREHVRHFGKKKVRDAELIRFVGQGAAYRERLVAQRFIGEKPLHRNRGIEHPDHGDSRTARVSVTASAPAAEGRASESMASRICSRSSAAAFSANLSA